MALAKRVKVGGSLYKGYSLVVSSAVGDYVLAIIPTTKDFAMNGITVTPDSYGAGDYFGLLHMGTVATAGGTPITTLAETVYNLGAGVTIMFDFASLELVKPGESVRFVYHNVATKAMNVYVSVETVR